MKLFSWRDLKEGRVVSDAFMAAGNIISPRGNVVEMFFQLSTPLPWKRVEEQDYGRVTVRGWAWWIFFAARGDNPEGALPTVRYRWHSHLRVRFPTAVCMEKPQ